MISTRGRYAIRVMLDLARDSSGSLIPLKAIADSEGISKKYLEIIVRDLVAGELIEGVSGKGGGYRLRRRPDQYSVGEILELTENSLSSVSCLAADSNDCPRKEICPTLPMWEELDQLVHDFFYSKKLSDLI